MQKLDNLSKLVKKSIFGVTYYVYFYQVIYFNMMASPLFIFFSNNALISTKLHIHKKSLVLVGFEPGSPILHIQISTTTPTWHCGSSYLSSLCGKHYTLIKNHQL